jgi:hypothetical protein
MVLPGLIWPQKNSLLTTNVILYKLLDHYPILFYHRIAIIYPKTTHKTDRHTCTGLPVILPVHLHLSAFFAHHNAFLLSALFLHDAIRFSGGASR